MEIICEQCNKKLDCPCKNERYVKDKYKSCAMTDDEYPQSRYFMKSNGCYWIHVCSEDCNNLLLEKTKAFMRTLNFFVSEL